jgi:hypothetical protein
MRFLKVSGCASAGGGIRGVIDSEVGFLNGHILECFGRCSTARHSHHVINQNTKAITHPTFNVGHHHLAAVDL